MPSSSPVTKEMLTATRSLMRCMVMGSAFFESSTGDGNAVGGAKSERRVAPHRGQRDVPASRDVVGARSIGAGRSPSASFVPSVEDDRAGGTHPPPGLQNRRCNQCAAPGPAGEAAAEADHVGDVNQRENRRAAILNAARAPPRWPPRGAHRGAAAAPPAPLRRQQTRGCIGPGGRRAASGDDRRARASPGAPPRAVSWALRRDRASATWRPPRRNGAACSASAACARTRR